MGMTTATIIVHQGINTGMVFGRVSDFTGVSPDLRVISALFMCIVLRICFITIVGFFTARFEVHPFISTTASMLITFGFITHVTKGVSFGVIDPAIPRTIILRLNGFPTIILRMVAAILIARLIWNKTMFGKNLHAVGGSLEAASVSGIFIFGVTMETFILAGILHSFGSWLECARVVGSGSVAYDQGRGMDVIATCVVNDVSLADGTGKVSSTVADMLIFTALICSLTTLGVDTNLQFILKSVIIIATVTPDCLRYVQRE